MIVYMPFTYVSKHHLEWITTAMGRVSLYSMASLALPAHMEALRENGMLDLRTPVIADMDHVSRARDQFHEWARLHGGGISEMSSYFRSLDGQPPLVDASSATQISTRIRHYGEQQGDSEKSASFRAAVFLSMAHDYDMHQDETSSALDAVAQTEKTMLARLSGFDSGPAESSALSGSSGAHQIDRDEAGAFMTETRIEAWSRLAVSDGCPAQLYLTTSRAVMDHVLACFPAYVSLGGWHLPTAQDTGYDANAFRKAIETLSQAQRPEPEPLADCLAPATPDNAIQIEIAALTGCTPSRLPHTLMLQKKDRPDRSGDEARFALMGLVCDNRSGKDHSN